MKRILIVAISLLVFFSDWLWRVICRMTGTRPPHNGVVLYYHSMPKEKRPAFSRQMDELLRRCKPLRADALGSATPGACYAAVTFDDGYQNIVDHALPELAQRGIPATLFIVPGALGRTPGWEDYSTGDPAMNEPIISEDQLRKLPSDLVQIGSHTWTHPMLPALLEEEARNELSRSRVTLEEITKTKVKSFSFPYGAFNDNLIRWCRDAGYERVFTTQPRNALFEANEYVVGRVVADPDDWPLEFSLKLSGAYRWLPHAFALKRRVLSSIRLTVREKRPAMTL